MFTPSFDPHNVDLDTASARDVACYQQLSENGYTGGLGGRISALFVILVVSTAGTVFPVLAKRVKWLNIPLYVYLFARYFGSGVIVATAFVHLLDPAYSSIGPYTCVGMTPGTWSAYSWTPAILLASCMGVFLIDVGCQEYVRQRYGFQTATSIEEVITARNNASSGAPHVHTQEEESSCGWNNNHNHQMKTTRAGDITSVVGSDDLNRTAFRQQFMAFFIMEAGIILHSVFIGLNFGVADDEWKTLYPVLIFHQSFEGLGIGARMSAIPFPRDLTNWLPWVLCMAYGLTTPIAIAIGLGVRTTYSSGGMTALVVSGIADAISAGILMYNGLVELLARDFLFDPERRRDFKRLCFMIFCVLLGAGIMSLLGKWA